MSGPDIATALGRVPLFGELNDRERKQLARLCQERGFAEGTAIVEQGKMSGIGFFVVAEGEAAVAVDGSEVARLGPGEHFGELALITEGVRTATVTAATPLRCYVIPLWDFRTFVREHADVSWKLLEHLATLLAERRARRAAAEAPSAAAPADG